MSQARFDYFARSTTGDRIKGTVRARDRREAIGQVKRLGYQPVSVQATAGSSRVTLDAFRRISQYEIAVFTRQLASLLNAGLTVTAALKALSDQTTNPRLRHIVQDIEHTISQEACSLAEALELHPKAFDAVYIGLVQSGETGGNVVEVLSSLAKRMTESAKLKGQVFNAMMYPAFLLVIGITAVFVLVSFVIPRFNELFASFGATLPLPTRMLVSASDFFSRWWWLVVVLVALAVGLVVVGLKRKRFRRAVDRAMLRLPVIGTMLVKVEVARVARTLSTMVSGGVRIVEALTVTGRTASNTAFRDSFAPIIKGVSSGEPLADMFEKASLYPMLMINLVRTGEDTGELPEMLDDLASIYEDEAERALGSAVKLLEPVLVLCIGMVVAGIVAAVILPIFQVNTMIE